MYKYELHLHTAESSLCAVATAKQQVQKYKERGYQGIVVTDHFINGNSRADILHDHTRTDFDWHNTMKTVIEGYKNAKIEGDKIGLDVFFGWEFGPKCTGTDLLTYGLGPEFLLQNPYIHTLGLEQYSTLIRQNGGFITQAHPYRNREYITNVGPVDPKYIDAVEIFNLSDPDINNEKAKKFAIENNLAMQGGSDTHDTNHEFASGIILKEKAKNIHDIIKAIKNGTAEVIIPC